MLNGLVAVCKEQVMHIDEDVTIALHNAHSNTHTAVVSKKRKQLTELKSKKETSMVSRKFVQALWKLYKLSTDLSEAECSLQLMYSCSEEQREQLYRKYPNITRKPEIRRSSKILSKTEQVEKCRQRTARGPPSCRRKCRSAKMSQCQSAAKAPSRHCQRATARDAKSYCSRKGDPLVSPRQPMRQPAS